VPMVYLPIHVKSDTGMRGYYKEARVSGDPAALIGAVRDAVCRAEPPLLTNERLGAESHAVRDHFSGRRGTRASRVRIDPMTVTLKLLVPVQARLRLGM
jgi:hypothetical protein